MAEDVNANFLDADWWKTATVEDVRYVISNGLNINAMDCKTLDSALEKVVSLISDTKDLNYNTSDVLSTIDINMEKIGELDKQLNHIETAFLGIIDAQIREISELDRKKDRLERELEEKKERIEEKNIAISAY